MAADHRMGELISLRPSASMGELLQGKSEERRAQHLIHMQILVLGMHRSGTSMVARLLNMMGVYFAPEGVSTGANQENPKGFWERQDVRALNDMVLNSAGADWHRLSGFSLEKVPESSRAQFKREAGKIILAMDAHRPWFLKEPRLCVLAPLWLELLEFSVCVLANRSPLEVAQSLEMRNGFPLSFGLALWERYSTAALNATRGQRRIQLNHAGLMTDPVGTVRQLQEKLEALGVRGLSAPSDEEIRAFIDPSLYRAKGKQIRAQLSPTQRRLRDGFQQQTILLSQKAIHFSAESQEVLKQHDRWMETEEKQNRQIAKLREEVIALEKKLGDRSREFSSVVAEQKKTIEKRDGQIQEQRQQIEERRKRAIALEGAIEKRDRQIQEQRQQIEERRKRAIALKGAIERRDRQVQEQRERASALQKAVERRDAHIQQGQRQLQEQREKASALQKAVERRDAHIQQSQRQLQEQRERASALQNQLKRVEQQWGRDFAKLGKWSDRIAQDLARLLKSNRWRLGCWLSLKRSGDQSKEVQRFSQLLATRPHRSRWKENPAHDGATNQGQKPRALADRNVLARDAILPPAVTTGIAEPAPPINDRQVIAVQPAAPTMVPIVSPTSVARMAETKPAAPAREQQPSLTQPSIPRKADVIVCVHNALDDVRRCLTAIDNHPSARLNKLILVNDGSNEQTTSYLRQFAGEAQVETVLLASPQPTGYTKAANRGLAAREAEYAILLNSDTIVTPDWIDRLIACGESHSSIGIIGPISNAASWQSVPERYSQNGDWAVNDLPSALDRVSCIFSILYTAQYPRVPLVNGFCFAIKSAVIDAIGMLDEELFPKGYGEENDYCLRAGQAGFSPAIADDCYLFHAKSRSYSHETRRKLARQSQAILRQKYGLELDKATDVLKNLPELAQVRSVFARLLDAQPCSILFLMNFRGAGGGINSIVQEANGLRKLGAAVQVAIRSQDKTYYRERFPGVARNLFRICESTADLIAYARSFEFVVATLFKGVRIVKKLLEQSPDVVPCYYIQDYEPTFFHSSEANYREARESYTLIPEMRCFAKTQWLCETIARKHGVHVHKVEPSIDRDIFFSNDRSKPGTPFVVCAMVRPMSERRSPGLTFEILRRIKREFGESVEIRMFGLEQDDPFLDRQPPDFEYEVLGILNREKVAELMRESSLFIDASTYQAFGRTGLEAMACRCATILPAEGGISEYAADGVNTLLAAPNDAGDVLQKVRRYLKEPQLYQRVVEEGLRTASRYSIEEACLSELKFFEALRQEPRELRSVAPPRVARSNSHVAA